MTVKLRYYQTAAVNAAMGFFRAKTPGNPLIEMPTGSGKSHVLAAICEEIQGEWGDIPILILSHTKEILVQDYEKLRLYMPEKIIGLYSSGLGIRDIENITVAGIHSVFRKPQLFKHFKLIIIDECHLIPAQGEGMYRTFLGKIGDYKLLGLTATPFRTGFGKLTDPGHLFSKTIHVTKIDDLIEKKYLAPLISRAADFQMDPSKVKVVAGDFVVKQLGIAFDQNTITKQICNELIAYKESRKYWLLFAIDIKHAEHVANELSALGINACYVHSKMKEYERDTIIELFRNGTFQVLVNVAVLTTGFDYPDIDLIGLLRPTRSPVLHVQMIGRGSRIATGKDNCLVLDFAGNLQRLGPINSEFDFKSSKGGGEAPTKICPQCSEVLYISTKKCNCGYEFKSTKISNLSRYASEAPVISKPESLKVSRIYYHRHMKKDSPDSLKVTYLCEFMKTIREYIAFEHPYGRKYAIQWWAKHSASPTPKTVTEALEKMNELSRPSYIRVDTQGKYPKVTGYDFRSA